MVRSLAAVAIAGALLLSPHQASAAARPGFLDTRLAYLLGEKINAVSVTPAGRILVAGGPRAFPGRPLSARGGPSGWAGWPVVRLRVGGERDGVVEGDDG